MTDFVPAVGDDVEEEDDQSVSDAEESPAPRRRQRVKRESGDGAVPDALAWLRTLCSPAVLQAACIAAGVVLTILLTPVDSFVLKYFPVLMGLPHADSVIKAVLAAVALTVLRPPPIV